MFELCRHAKKSAGQLAGFGFKCCWREIEVLTAWWREVDFFSAVFMRDSLSSDIFHRHAAIVEFPPVARGQLCAAIFRRRFFLCVQVNTNLVV